MTTLQVWPAGGDRPTAPPASPPTPTTPAAPGRSLGNYLLLPRPKDLVKSIVVPLTFAVGAVSVGGVTGTRLWHALVVWLVLELLVYQARYQWNDVRGFAADQSHPQGAARGRLPGPVTRARAHIGASLLVVLLRLALVAGVALAVPELAGLVVAMTLGVFGVALVYEHLRSAATGRTREVPVPLRPALVGLWVAVGAGYAVRGLTGLALAMDLSGRPALVATAAVSMWALGVVFVTCRWALEAMCFGSWQDGQVRWAVRADQAREHTLGLVRWLPRAVDPRDVDVDPSVVDLRDEPRTPDLAQWRALQGPTVLRAPWNLAVVLSAATAGLAGRMIQGGSGVAGGVAVLLLAGAAALVVTRIPRHRFLAAIGSALPLAVLPGSAGHAGPPVAALLVLVVLLGYACFTHQCAAEIGHPLRRLPQLLRR